MVDCCAHGKAWPPAGTRPDGRGAGRAGLPDRHPDDAALLTQALFRDQAAESIVAALQRRPPAAVVDQDELATLGSAGGLPWRSPDGSSGARPKGSATSYPRTE
ncbi:hypothetical protein ACU686_22855, partial [Yinghuangia aomiensis]